MNGSKPFSLGLVAVVLIVGLVGPSSGAPTTDFEHRSSLLADPHIINGRDTDIKEVPYQISIESFRLHTCGGVIISENYALTAAHCVDPWISGITWLKRIRAGSTFEFPFSWGGSIHQIQEAEYHPNWSLRTIDYDVGYIKVSNKFIFGQTVQPIAIPRLSDGESFLDFSQNASVSGWGRTSRDAIFLPWHLQSVQIPLVPREKCVEIHEDTKYDITPRMLCAAGTGRGGPCQGDSGGPMVHKGTLVGLVSWGLRCNDARFPTVFTNVLNEEVREYVKEKTGI